MSDTMPPVSVIVPVYNMAERLATCLDSLLAQTLPNLEIVLVNDGSTDGSGDICRDYASRHSAILFHEDVNRGVSAAYNAGLERASGRYVAFCDSDDYVVPQMYQVLYDRAMAAEAEISCCRLRRGRDLEQVRGNAPELLEGVFERDEILDKWFLPLLLPRLQKPAFGYNVLCLFCRSILECQRIRYRLELSMHEDSLFILEFLPHVKRMTATPEAFYHYIFHEESLSAKYFIKKEMPLQERAREWLVRAECLEQLVNREVGVAERYPWLTTELTLNRLFHQCRFLAYQQPPMTRSEKIRQIRAALLAVKPKLAWPAGRALPRRHRLFQAVCLLGEKAVYYFCRCQKPRQI